jgi:diadenosine tetraphosphate (Ap4A) HIT family hydrolase
MGTSQTVSPFAAILSGDMPGQVVARDDRQRFAIIASLEPEAAIHWLAVPFEPGFSTEDMKHSHGDRFLALLDYALDETKARVDDYPELANGFTIKFHVGAYETVPHAKFHILSVE